MVLVEDGRPSILARLNTGEEEEDIVVAQRWKLVLWKGSERRIGMVRLVKEKRFGKIAAMIFTLHSVCVFLCGRALRFA